MISRHAVFGFAAGSGFTVPRFAALRFAAPRFACVGLWLLAVVSGCGLDERSVNMPAFETSNVLATPAGPAVMAAEPNEAAPEAPADGRDSPSSEGQTNGALPLQGAIPGAGSGSQPATPTPAEDPPAAGSTDMPGQSTPPDPPSTDPALLPSLTVWIAGDSTVANGETPCPRGWGGVIGARFDERVKINNSAVGGRSVHTWLYMVGQELDAATGECTLARDAAGAPLLQPRWQAMLDGMKAGDYLFIQFGINDGDPACDRHVGLDAFETAYAMMADAATARGAHPVFLTPVSSISCNGSTARGSRGAFVTSTLAVGERSDVPVIDLHARSVALYNEHGFCPVAGGDVSATTTGAVGDFFCDDHTHFSPTGAVEIADVVVQALRDQGIPLAAYLK
jgi:lysophospholipase L1-like esterase